MVLPVFAPIAVKPHPILSCADTVLPSALGLGHVVGEEGVVPPRSAHLLEGHAKQIEDGLAAIDQLTSSVTNPYAVGDALAYGTVPFLPQVNIRQSPCEPLFQGAVIGLLAALRVQDTPLRANVSMSTSFPHVTRQTSKR